MPSCSSESVTVAFSGAFFSPSLIRGACIALEAPLVTRQVDNEGEANSLIESPLFDPVSNGDEIFV